MRKLPHIIATLFLILIMYAQKQVMEGGAFSGTVTWKGTIYIRGDIEITETGRLVIEPGTTVFFESNSDLMKGGNDKTRSELIIKGTLNARGQLKEKILFTSSAEEPRFGDWYGIQFMHVKSQSVMDFCIIEYAYNGITIKNSLVQVSNSEIRSNFYAGIMVEVKSDPKIIHNIITENDYAGVVCRKAANPILTDNLIRGNRIGVIAFDVSEPDLGSLASGSQQNPGRNQIFDNMEYNVYNHSSRMILAQNNAWGTGRFSEIKKTIFDSSNDGKYGMVNFRPYQERTDYRSHILLAQGKREEIQPATVVVEGTATEVVPQRNVTLPIINPAVVATREGSAAVNEESQAADIQDEAVPVQEEKLPETIERQEALVLADVNTAELPLVNEDADTADIEPQNKGPQIDYDAVFLEAFLDNKKKYRKQPKVPYTNALRSFWQQGRINVTVWVNKKGSIDSAKVSKGLNAVLDKAVLETVKQYQYEPGTLNGQNVKFQAMEVFSFDNR
jgi:TonB family protein